jgi:hypothetical protein
VLDELFLFLSPPRPVKNFPSISEASKQKEVKKELTHIKPRSVDDDDDKLYGRRSFNFYVTLISVIHTSCGAVLS